MNAQAYGECPLLFTGFSKNETGCKGANANTHATIMAHLQCEPSHSRY